MPADRDTASTPSAAPGAGAADGADDAPAAERTADDARDAEHGRAGLNGHESLKGHERPRGHEGHDGRNGPDRPDTGERGEGDGDGDGDEFTVRDPVSAPDAEGRPRRVTRRFPLFTRDTARPEGGGRAASGDAPAPARQWPVLAVLGLAGLGLLITAFDQFRLGTLLIGVALLGGGAMRWLLPDVGMLAVRSRFTDIVTYGVLGTVIVLLALMAQPNPLLQIPFLKDTLHFTVTSE
ncbi:DUF3017 domain-containing protein [Streptomyces sp. NPDC029554]|uniref:DUF3017 domain-containing protein n=1 Tax=Streptomyces sp. NPDC029554 TaxID=3155126 RepID=UPI0033E9D0EA